MTTKPCYPSQLLRRDSWGYLRVGFRCCAVGEPKSDSLLAATKHNRHLLEITLTEDLKRSVADDRLV